MILSSFPASESFILTAKTNLSKVYPLNSPTHIHYLWLTLFHPNWKKRRNNSEENSVQKSWGLLGFLPLEKLPNLSMFLTGSVQFENFHGTLYERKGNLPIDLRVLVDGFLGCLVL